MPLPTTNKFQQDMEKNKIDKTGVPDSTIRITFGRITEIDTETFQVKVKLVNGNMLGETDEGDFFPLINDLDDIQMRFGKLRENMAVRIFWEGKVIQRNALVEVIGEEGHEYIKKIPVNSGGVGVYKIASPGLGVI